MDITVSDQAAAYAYQRGGVINVHFIPPLG